MIVLVSASYFPIVGYSVSSCFVFGFVVYVFPCQSTGGDPVLFFFCLAVYDSSFEMGVVFDLDVVSFFSCVDARLFCDAFVGGVCVCLSFSSAYADGASRCVIGDVIDCFIISVNFYPFPALQTITNRLLKT